MKKSFNGAVLLTIMVALAGCTKASKNASLSAEVNEEDAANGTNEANGVANDSQEENAAVANEMPTATSEYVVVNSPEGINVRETPDLSAQRIAGLADKTVVKLLQKGPETTIDAIASNWLEIEMPEEIARKSNVKSGWVCSKDKFSSTADGFKMSETKQFYTRKNADVRSVMECDKNTGCGRCFFGQLHD